MGEISKFLNYPFKTAKFVGTTVYFSKNRMTDKEEILDDIIPRTPSTEYRY